MAADAMVHNNCTTGVEAFMLGKPAISYSPYRDATIDHPLPEKVSYSASNKEELIKLIDDVIHKKNYLDTEREKQIKFASDYIANIDGKLACDRIMDVLDGLDLPNNEATFPLKSIYTNNAIKIIKRIKMSILPEKMDTPSKEQQKTLQIFSGLDINEVKDILKQFQQVSGRFSDIQVVAVDKDSYCFFKK
jgi:hypothetical protein